MARRPGRRCSPRSSTPWSTPPRGPCCPPRPSAFPAPRAPGWPRSPAGTAAVAGPSAELDALRAGPGLPGSATRSAARSGPASGWSSRPSPARRGRLPATTDGWRLEFALQAADEPSLVVDAEHGLAGHAAPPGAGPAASTRHRRPCWPSWAGPAGSTRSSTTRCAPPGRPRSTSTPPARTSSSASGAPLLAGAGFGVLLPGWWSRPPARLGARLTAQPPRPARHGRHRQRASASAPSSTTSGSWPSATSRSPRTSCAALAELKAPLVRLRGQWVELDAAPAGRRRCRAARPAAGQMTVADLLHLGLAHDGRPRRPAGGRRSTADGWLGDLLAGEAERRLEPVADAARRSAARCGRTRSGAWPG